MLCDSAIEVKSPESDILSNYSPFRVKIHQKMPVTNDGSGEQKSKIKLKFENKTKIFTLY